MITNLIRAASIFSSHYRTSGISFLNNCQNLAEFQQIISQLEAVKAENLGLRPSELSTYFRKGRTTYFKVYENPDFSMGVFCLSKGWYSFSITTSINYKDS